jgi:hypothetical protein
MKTLNINITLTYSKLLALLIFLGSFAMDFANDKQGTVFMFALPFVVFLITGKQFFDAKKPTTNGQ